MTNPTAAILVIGDEILSGRTLDTNTQYIAKAIGAIGVDLMETRTIHDDKQKIIDCVLEFSKNYDYVFTSGGIGPTHDDITSEALSEAFGRKYVQNKDAYNILERLYHTRGEKMTPARAKMAHMPENADLITYTPEGAPGFIVENVYALAGVPYIMEAMIRAIVPTLRTGSVVKSRALDVMLGESMVASAFDQLQKKYQDVQMGSYPFLRDGEHGTSLVLRSRNYDMLDKAYNELEEVVEKIKF